MQYEAPQSLEAASALLAGASGTVRVLAGGTDLLVQLRSGLIGAADLDLMKPDAYLINTSRGPIVDENALVEALQAERIAGAALDVYEREPLPPDDPLRRVPHLLLTPHIGFVTREAYKVFYADMVEGIAAFLAGQPQRVITE